MSKQLILKTKNNDTALKGLKKQLRKTREGIKDALIKKQAQLKEHGLDPHNLESSLKNSQLQEDQKKMLLDKLHAAESKAAPKKEKSSAAKKLKTSPNRLNV